MEGGVLEFGNSWLDLLSLLGDLYFLFIEILEMDRGEEEDKEKDKAKQIKIAFAI